MTTLTDPVIIFDGVCNLCNATVRFILARNTAGNIRFCAAQSEAGLALQRKYGLAVLADETFVLIDGDRYWLRSDAALMIAAELRLPWSLMPIFRIVPRVIRDGVYRFIARRRYRWFGMSDTCTIQIHNAAGRFLT